MAMRELRSSWRRLLLFFLCIAVGVGSIVSLRSLIQNIKNGIGREARVMYGGDVRVGLNHPWKEVTRATLERYSAAPMVTAHTEILETQTMVLAANDPNARPYMVQLRAVQERFPLYGEVQMAGDAPYSHALLKGKGVIVQSGLLDTLNLKVGDTLKIGQLTFTIRGVMKFLPGNAMEFRPIQRVAVDYTDAEAAGLTSSGGLVSYGWLFKTREGEDEALLKELAREFKGTRLNWLGSFRFQEDWLSRSAENTEGFLGLVGLAVLVLGGIGVSSVTRVFVQQKLKTIAILKCLGGVNRQVLGAYLAQALALSLLGGLMGLLLASGVTRLAADYAAGRLPVRIAPGLTRAASLQGVLIGMLITLFFSLPPLLEIRLVKPILVLRSFLEHSRLEQRRFGRRVIDWTRLGSNLLLAVGLFLLAFWVSGRLNKVGIFLGEVAGAALILNLVGAVLTSSLRRVRHIPSFALRQGVGSLYRPGNQTRVILSAVGLGALFLIAVRLQQVNVLRQYDFELDTATADVFVIDLQKDQRAAAEATLKQLSGDAPKLVPIVQGRIVELDRAPGNWNEEAGRLSADELRNRLRWEQRFTYRPNLEARETIVAGKFWEPTASAEPEVSVEERYARDLALGVGDKLGFNILGKRVDARVTSIRRLERHFSPSSLITRFAIVFRPGALESAPQMFIGAVKGPPPGAQRARLQREFAAQFPNVTLIDAFDLVAEVRKRAGELSFSVSFAGGFVFLCGALILAGSIAMTKYQRLYESAILKTLGARKKLIIYITLIEYGALGLLAGLVGSAAAIALTWAICKYDMRIDWRLEPVVNLSGVALTSVLVAAVGVLSSWDVMVKKPLGILRTE
jgi:putative ABC transport system permease protein